MIVTKNVYLIGIIVTTLLLLFQFVISLKKDPYELLGVRKSATDKEIKKAFRKLSLKYHPDKNKDPNAENTFREIAEAYSILSDPEKRKRYDQFGHEDSSGTSGHGFHETQFNMNDFFKHFDEAFQHQGSHHGHHKHSFGGFNFDDLFEGMDSEEFGFFNQVHDHFHSFDDFGHEFGGQDSFFGSHMTSHHESYEYSSGSQGRCRTVTKRTGNSVYTHTECS